jgi:hypothetical protein
MATLEELEAGLRKAHAAGNADHARRFADAIRQMRGSQPKQRITAEQARDPSLIPDERYRAAGMEPPKRGSGSSGNRYSDYLAGVGKSIVDTASGIRQYAVDAAGDPANALGPLGKPLLRAIAGDRFDAAAAKSPTLQGVRNYSQRLRNEEAERRQVLPSVSEDPAFALGNVVGTLGQLFTPGAALRGTTAGRAALPTTAGGNALQGLALGTVQPVAGQGERDVNQAVGGLAGWLGAAVPQAVGAATRPVRSAIGDLLGQPTASGVERRAADLIRQEAADVGSLMRPAPSAVPGVQRTLAEESLDPGVARLERQLRGSGPAGVFAPIDQANAAARVRSIESIAGTDADMAAAEAARDQAAGALRDQAFSEAERTAAQQIRAQALALGVPLPQTNLQAQVSAIASQNATRPSVQSALNDVSRALAKSDGSAASLYGVRQYIGDLLSGKAGGDKGYAMAASRELMGVRDMVDQELARLAPSFPAYLSAFREGSIPISRMQVGRELLDRGAGSAIADPVTGVRPLTPAGFSRQANDLDSLAARATGFDKARADQILTPDDIAKIRAVQDDLERQAFRATAGSGGNSMTQERQALARRMGRSAIQSVPVVGRFAESLEAMGEKRLNDTLARLIANPEEARRVLSTLNAKDRAVVNKALLQISARTGAAVPALAE